MTNQQEREAVQRKRLMDVTFAITGGPVPVDHGYPLFAALCRTLGDLHGADWLAVHPLRGTWLGAGKVALRDGAALTLRIDQEHIREVMPLAGKTLEVAGAKVQVGVPRLQMLRAAPSLVARTVIFKHHMTPETFLPHVLEELTRRGFRADVELGRRRIVTVAGDRVVGFGLRLDALSEEEALRLQAEGIGGRQHFGCGVLVPGARSPRGGAHHHA